MPEMRLINRTGGAEPPAERPEEELTLLSEGEASTAALGERLGREATGGEVIALIGPLGAGKTRFVQGLARGLDVPSRYVNSPTFILLQCHEGRLPLYHIDLYRLERAAEFEALGLEEFLEGDGVCAGEWADKGLALLPPARLTATFRYAGEGRREIDLSAVGESYIQWLRKIKEERRWEIAEKKK